MEGDQGKVDHHDLLHHQAILYLLLILTFFLHLLLLLLLLLYDVWKAPGPPSSPAGTCRTVTGISVHKTGLLLPPQPASPPPPPSWPAPILPKD
jgi:hypothetical protein